jgi:hypothetical protein
MTFSSPSLPTSIPTEELSKMASETSTTSSFNDLLWYAILSYVSSPETSSERTPPQFLENTHKRFPPRPGCDLSAAYSHSNNPILEQFRDIPNLDLLLFAIFTCSVRATPNRRKELLVCIAGTVRDSLHQLIFPYYLKVEVTWALEPEQSLLPGWADAVEILRFGVSSAFYGDRSDGWQSFQNPALGLVGVRVTPE